jgi:uncharacterized protein YjbJ (UPF0337 family)
MTGGRTKRAKGRAKESAGALMDDKEMKDRGRMDQAEGTARKKADAVTDKVADAAKKVKRKTD